MNQHFFLLVFILLPFGVFAQDIKNTITAEELKGHVFFLASDEMKGRGTGTDEFRRVAEYAASQFRAAGLKAVLANSDKSPTFLQPFSFKTPEWIKKRRVKDNEKPLPTELKSFNVIGIIEGTDPVLQKEFVTIGAHLDHLGIRKGKIHNGANDNASGSASVMEIAEEIAKRPLKRSVLFALWGAEEVGLVGSRYFVSNSPIPVDRFVVNLNIDGIGRYNNQSKDEIKLQALGADAICKNLQAVMKQTNTEFGKLTLDENDSNRYFYTSSDQVPFHKKGIPAIMFTDLGSGVYHSPEDDAEPIEYEKLKEVTIYINDLAAKLGNMKTRVCPGK